MNSPICSFLVFFLVQGAAFAQDAPKPFTQSQSTPAPPAVQRMMDLEQRHQRTLSGAGLRRGQMLTLFLAVHGPADDNAFAQFVLERYGATGIDVETLKQARVIARSPPPIVDICERVLDGSLPGGASIAKYVEQANDDYDRKLAAPYQAALDKLSPRVRANVLRTIDQESVNVSGSELDNVAAAKEDPELYKLMVQSRCAGKKRALQQPPLEIPPPPGSPSSNREL